MGNRTQLHIQRAVFYFSNSTMYVCYCITQIWDTQCFDYVVYFWLMYVTMNVIILLKQCTGTTIYIQAYSW